MPGKVDTGFPSGIATEEETSYSSRANVFQHAATWRLGADAISREGGEPADAPLLARAARLLLRILFPWWGIRIDPGGPANAPYSSIAEIRLSFDPTRFDARRHRCDVRLADGRSVTIWSTHYVSVGEFEDRAATYTPFVRALIARAAAANPACRFRAGKRPLVYWAEHTFLVAMVALLVFVIAAVGGAAFSELVLVKLGIVAASIPLALLYARKNRPRRFTSDAIPDDVLPSAGH